MKCQRCSLEGRQPERPGPSEDPIAGAFFETAGIPLKQGRFFSDQDTRTAPPVAIVNEIMAQTYWPGEEPIGKRFRFPSQRSNSWITIVGVVGNMHRQGLEKRTIPQVFRPLAQETDDMLEIVVHTSADSPAMASAIRSAIQSIDKNVARFEISTVEQQLEEQTAARRFQTSLIAVFSVLALLLSAVGIYGLMHHFVVQRTNEIGVRMALGASTIKVVSLVLQQGLMLASVGILVGISGALALTRLLTSVLYGVTPTDWVTFTATPAVLLGVAALACAIPARRAARIDPVIALRRN